MTGQCPMRQDLEPLPARMADLPVDSRGYPIPWFVDWINGEPEFRAMDRAKFMRALKEKLCWVCGERLGIHITFTAGPMCGINRTSSEPPCHRECARWSARNCPFLSNPNMVRRTDGLDPSVLDNMAGFGLKRNPGVTMPWNTREWEIFMTETGPLIQMGEPESVEWWHCGKPATREEVEESIASGIPNLEALARQEKGGLEALAEARARFQRWLPA